jgi:hypothetical protein
MKLRRCSGIINHDRRGIGPQSNVGHRIYSEKGESFTTVRSGESAGGLTWKPFGLRDFGEVR